MILDISPNHKELLFMSSPNEPSLRVAWLRALGKEDWRPKERSAICSEHFLCDDLYETRSGLRKVRVGAVPIIVQDSTVHDYGEPASLRVCRICLVVDSKLFPIRKYNLDAAYEHLTGLRLCEEDKLPQKLCTECAYRLLNCNKFRNKSLRANSLMLEIIRKQEYLTIQNIQTINRENNQLTSPLTRKLYETDHYDLHIESDDQTDLQTNEKEETVPDMHQVTLTDVIIKDETPNDHIFINENDVFNQEVKPDNYNDCLIQNNVADENDVDFVASDKDYVASDKDFVASDKDYSSDDSLPLERRRVKSKEKQKRKIEKKVSVKKVRKSKVKKDPSQPKIDRRRKPFLNDDLNETLFTITDLSTEEQLAEIQKRQGSANYKNSVFKCTACFKGFLDEDAYNGHIIRHTDQCGEYECEICKTHFKHPHALRKHITAHHTQRFSCNQCPYVTTHRQTARLHERWHKGTKYQCPHCQEEFVRFTTYMGHIRIKHPSDFVCELCGYSFVSEKGIELHKKLKHTLDNMPIPQDGPFCELCNVRFATTEALKRHVQVSARHNTGNDKEPKEANQRKKPRKPREPKDSKDPKSPLKNKKSKDSNDRRRYPSQMRKAEGPIPCEQCGLQLEDSRAYHGHFRRAHPDKNRTNYPSMKSPCMCEVCGRMFQSYALLKDHRWVHTGERPFKCESCGKAFRMKQRLVAHRRVHSQVKATYVCSLCGKHFSTHSNRQRHMFIHTGLKPFKCEMCGKCFKHASEKRAHITYVHLKKPWPKRARGKRRHDARQGPLPSQHPEPTGATEMDIVQPLWPPCDPKLGDINSMIDDKPMYYNLKI